MSCRQAAALSLLGWYLLSPLPRADPKTGGTSGVLIDADRPLREWKIRKSFPTAGECQAYLKNWIIEQRLEAERLPKPAPSQALLELNTRSNSQCVASDDPRLGSRQGRQGIDADLAELGALVERLERVQRVTLLACGTAWHAGLIGGFFCPTSCGARRAT